MRSIGAAIAGFFVFAAPAARAAPSHALARTGPGEWSFQLAEGQDSLRYRPLAHRHDTWYGSTYWTGPGWTRVGKDWHHPGDRTPSVRRFTCPRDGRITVAGRAFKLHADPKTDGVRLAIRHGARDIWTAEIDGADATGVEHALDLVVRKGDVIRFVVHKRGIITCDTTGWDPVIAYAGGERLRASEGFATSARPGDPWGYEMEVGDDRGGLPRAYAFRPDLDPHVEMLAPDREIALTDRDHLPMLVVANGEDREGVVVTIIDPPPWRIRAALDRDGWLRIRAEAADVRAYRGSWIEGMGMLPPIAPPGLDPGELVFWTMIVEEWRRQDGIAGSPESCADAAMRQIERARALLADLRKGGAPGFLAAEADEIEACAREAERRDADPDARRSLYLRVRGLKRRIALANPLLSFGELLFVKRVPTSYSHLVMQYFGWRARAGGGLFVLERPGRSLACRDILDGRLAGGNVLEPRLSYDARRIIFSYVEVTGNPYDPDRLRNEGDEGFYHIHEVGVDGTGLEQVTRGPYDDLMPAYLPDGGIVFSSTRRGGYARCFGGQFSRRWHVYTLHRVEADGTDLRCLSFHDTNEWFPAVSNDGLVLYSRWDYIDRDAVTHQNLWATRPDGTGAMALWGNATPNPDCTFQIRPIPGSRKIAFTASAHHSITAGSIAIVDPAVAVDGEIAITRITPEVPFPEAETFHIREYYAAPWPLSETYFLVAYSPTPLVWEPGANAANALGIYLLDAFGNRELLYRDPAIGSTNPCPIVPRTAPPVIPSELPRDAPPAGEIVLLDVYNGLGDIPQGRIRELRIVQIFPKTTNVANTPPIGLAGEENGRAILGTVPIEPDGSARFIAPAGRPILFQALDEDGFAYQTMRTTTYLQPGEVVSCAGCHENRRSTPASRAAAGTQAMALRRAPSAIDPGPLGGRPFSFVETVQPVLEARCVRCHGGERIEGKIDLSAAPAGAFTRSYVSLCGDRDFHGPGTNPKNAAEALVPRFGMRNTVQRTPPGGMYGARGSRLIRMLRAGHHDVRLDAGELRRLAAWIDLNAIFYGVYDPAEQARQLRGEAVAMPEMQ
ncbi:MAG: hypothetical protein JXP34_04775, partial [Planctomycetes bacterium]|nr:hypothetical protein [Planctomycetota bacterium]